MVAGGLEGVPAAAARRHPDVNLAVGGLRRCVYLAVNRSGPVYLAVAAPSGRSGTGVYCAPMSISVSDAVWRRSRATGMVKLLLVALAEHADADGWSYPSVGRLARRIGRTPRRVQQLIREAEQLGELRVERTVGGRRRTNRYQVTPGRGLARRNGETRCAETPKRASPEPSVNRQVGSSEEQALPPHDLLPPGFAADNPAPNPRDQLARVVSAFAGRAGRSPTDDQLPALRDWTEIDGPAYLLGCMAIAPPDVRTSYDLFGYLQAAVKTRRTPAASAS